MPHDVYLLQGNDDIAYDGLLSASIEQPAGDSSSRGHQGRMRNGNIRSSFTVGR